MFFPEEPLQCYCLPTLGLLFSIVWQEWGKYSRKRWKEFRTMACDLCQNLQERQAVNSEVDDPNPKAATVWLSMVHRCVNKYAPGYLEKHFIANSSLHGYPNTRGQGKLHLKHVQSEVGRYCFGFKGAQDWNQLPPEVTRVQRLPHFKNVLKTYLLNQ